MKLPEIDTLLGIMWRWIVTPSLQMMINSRHNAMGLWYIFLRLSRVCKLQINAKDIRRRWVYPHCYNDILTWKVFPHCRFLVREIHQTLENFPHRCHLYWPVMFSLVFFFMLVKLLNQHLSCRWLLTPWRPCDVNVKCQLHYKLIYATPSVCIYRCRLVCIGISIIEIRRRFYSFKGILYTPKYDFHIETGSRGFCSVCCRHVQTVSTNHITVTS